jgi:hypothetical protein
MDRTTRRLAIVATVLAGLALAVSVTGVALAGTGTFSDVPADHPFNAEIEWMAATGISTGFPDGTYRPGEPVTRQSMAAFMARLSDAFYVTSISATPGVEQNSFLGSAQCDGILDRALMGGGTTQSDELFISDSYPATTGTWAVRWRSDDGVATNAGTITTWVLCGPRQADTD